MSIQRLQPGDRVSHPSYGFGVIEGTQTFDQDGRPTEFYTVRISHGGTLTVPVDRAEALGLRVISNSLKVIAASLRGDAAALPDNDRERMVMLKSRWHDQQPGVLAQTVRDLLARGRTRRLTPADKRWLAEAVERLSSEVSLVDEIDLAQARAAVQREMEQITKRAA